MSISTSPRMLREVSIIEYRAHAVSWQLGNGIRKVQCPKDIAKEILSVCDEILEKISTWPRPDEPDGLRPLAEQTSKTLRPVLESPGGVFNDPDNYRVWIAIGRLRDAPEDILSRVVKRRNLIESILTEEVDNARNTRDD